MWYFILGFIVGAILMDEYHEIKNAPLIEDEYEVIIRKLKEMSERENNDTYKNKLN